MQLVFNLFLYDFWLIYYKQFLSLQKSLQKNFHIEQIIKKMLN